MRSGKILDCKHYTWFSDYKYIYIFIFIYFREETPHVYASYMSSTASSIYPSHFTEELKHHCRRSGIPPAVFHDLASAMANDDDDEEEASRDDTALLSCPLLFPFMVSDRPSEASPCGLSEPQKEGNIHGVAPQRSSGVAFPSRLPSRQSGVLARYLRLHTPALPSLLQVGAVLIVRWRIARGTAFHMPCAAGEDVEARKSDVVWPDVLSPKEVDTCPPMPPPSSLANDLRALCTLSVSLSNRRMPREERWRKEHAEAHRLLQGWRHRRTEAAASPSCSVPPFPTTYRSPLSSVPSTELQEEMGRTPEAEGDTPRRKGGPSEAYTKAAFFERLLYDAIGMALHGAGSVPLAHRTTAVPPCGGGGGGEDGPRKEEDHPLLEVEQTPTHVLERLPPLLVLWFAVSYLLQLPLFLVSPIRWSSPPWLSSCSAASVLSSWSSFAVDDGLPMASILFAFSPRFHAKVRGVASFPAEVFASASLLGGVQSSLAFPVPLSYFCTAMDAASVAAVMALQPQPHERVLDVCCAPGMKLQAAAEVVHGMPLGGDDEISVPLQCDPEEEEKEEGRGGGGAAVAKPPPPPLSSFSGAQGLVVGVDVDLPRLFVTRSLLQQRQAAFASPLMVRERDEILGCGTRRSRRLFPSPPALPVALFAGNGVTFSMPQAVACLQRPTIATPGSAFASQSVTVHPSTGLTAQEARRLQKRHAQRSTSHPHREADPTRVHASEPTPVLPVYVPPMAREAIFRLFTAHPCPPSLPLPEVSSTAPPPPAEHRDPHRSASRARASSFSFSSNRGPSSAAVAPTPSTCLFDAVMVDAECTHDGSLAHVAVRPPPPPSTSSATQGGVSSAFLSCTNPHRRPRPHVPATAGVEAAQGEGEGGGGHLATAQVVPTPTAGGIPRMGEGLYPTPTPTPLAVPLATSPLFTACPRWFWAPVLSPSQDGFFTWLREDALLQLQLALLFNAFRQVRVGGRLLYSTCTMSYRQNEYMVRCFLRLLQLAEKDVGDSTAAALECSGRDETKGKTGEKEKVPLAVVAHDTDAAAMPRYTARIVPPFPPDLWSVKEGQKGWHREEDRASRCRTAEKKCTRAPPDTERNGTALSSETVFPPSFHALPPAVEVVLRILTTVQECLLSYTSWSSSFSSSEEGIGLSTALGDFRPKTDRQGEATSLPTHFSFVCSRLDAYEDFLEALESSYDAYAIIRHGEEKLHALSSDDLVETTGVASPSSPLSSVSTKGREAPLGNTTRSTGRVRPESCTSGVSDASMGHSMGTDDDDKEDEEIVDGSSCTGHNRPTMRTRGAVQESHVGERLWPLVFKTSFQYIAKMEKVKRETD